MAEGSYGSVEEQLQKYGSYASNTVGVSMRPLFKTHRDVVIIKRCDGIIKKYDVVLYKRGGEYLLHRVIGIKEDVFVIRGDNTFTKEYVPRSEIIGVLVGFNRKGKRRNVTDFGYRLYSRFWNFLYPIRNLWRIVRTAFAKAYRKFFPGKNKKGEK